MKIQQSPRRKDREIGVDDAFEILDRAEYGTLSMIDTEGKPYGIPISFVREENRLIFHCALEGRKIDSLRKNPRVSFCAVGKTKVLPAQFSTEYESVLVEGTASFIEDAKRKTDALVILCKKYTPDHLDLAVGAIRKSLPRTGLFEVAIESISGKAKRPKED